MSVFIDRKFLHLLAPRLKRFSAKKEDLYNFRCPFCGDSSKNTHKARGYIYRKKNDYFYKCQNCGIGKNMYGFIEHLDPDMVKDYVLDRYRDGEETKPNAVMPEFNIPAPVFKPRVINLPKISELSTEHYARQYVENRKIPQTAWSNLFFAEDFKAFVDELYPEHGKELKESDPRLVIPFIDNHGTLLAVQGRALGTSKARYITIKLDVESIKVYGLNTANAENKIYVTEGPIDSLFLINGVATADANLQAAGRYLPKDKLTLVFDNEPRNKELHKIMAAAIEDHYKICIWPEMIAEKDINDMIKSGLTSEEIMDIIDANTFNNLRAHFEFTQWKKI